jgi:hypothetical protein
MGKKLETVKDIGGVIVGIGIGSIVDGIVKNNTSDEDGKIKKFCIWTGGLVLAGMAADRGIKYFHNMVDNFAETKKKEVKEETDKKED